jgi:predicted permease
LKNASLRWTLAIVGAGVIVGLIILVFLIGRWIAPTDARQACLDDGGAWVEGLRQCQKPPEPS